MSVVVDMQRNDGGGIKEWHHFNGEPCSISVDGDIFIGVFEFFGVVFINGSGSTLSKDDTEAVCRGSVSFKTICVIEHDSK